MSKLVLTVVGNDRAGLVKTLAGVIARHGGNWEESQMSELAGIFAGIVVVNVPDQQSEALIADLEPLEQQGLLDVSVQIAPADDDEIDSIPIALELMGSDRPGIVHEISEVLASFDVNVVQLLTDTRDAPMAGGVLFEAQALLEVPTRVDVSALRRALEGIANELMVDIDLSTDGN